jgi:hypothetical protein
MSSNFQKILENHTTGDATSSGGGALNGITQGAKHQFPSPPKFATKLEEREFLKFRLAQAFRIFGIIT